MQVKTTIFFLVSIHSMAVFADPTQLRDEADRIGYSIGHQIGMDYKRQNVELDEKRLRQGLADGENNDSPKVERKMMKSLLVELKKNITTSMKQEAVARIEKRNQDERQKRDQGETFLRQNQSVAGVKSLPSGVQYRILNSGEGRSPALSDFVTFNYRAKTLSGREYDSSFKKGHPASHRADSVLPGFSEVVQLMKPGSRWELYLPPEQAYGRQGPLAHQTIVLEVELLEIAGNR